MTSRKLGKNQKGVLISMVSPAFGRTPHVWHPHCGWNWKGAGVTLRVLQGLEQRGLVTKDAQVANPRRGLPSHVCYSLTPAGLTLALELKKEPR